MSRRLSNALGALSEGIGTFAAYRGQKEAVAEERAENERVRVANQEFQKSLTELSMGHSKEMQASGFAHAEKMAETSESAAVKRFNAQMGMQQKQLDLAKQQFEATGEDREISRRVNAIQSVISTASGQASSALDALEKQRADRIKNVKSFGARRDEEVAKINEEYDSRISERLQGPMQEIEHARRQLLEETGVQIPGINFEAPTADPKDERGAWKTPPNAGADAAENGPGGRPQDASAQTDATLPTPPQNAPQNTPAQGGAGVDASKIATQVASVLGPRAAVMSLQDIAFNIESKLAQTIQDPAERKKVAVEIAERVKNGANQEREESMGPIASGRY